MPPQRAVPARGQVAAAAPALSPGHRHASALRRAASTADAAAATARGRQTIAARATATAARSSAADGDEPGPVGGALPSARRRRMPLRPTPPELRTRRLRRCSAPHRCTTCCRTWSAPPSPRSCTPVNRLRWRAQRPPPPAALAVGGTIMLPAALATPGSARRLPRQLSRRRRSWLASARCRRQAPTSRCARRYRQPPRLKRQSAVC